MLTTTQSYVQYQGNGSTTVFPYTFLIPAASDLVVTITNNNVSPAVSTVLSSSQFTVTGLGNTSGGNVTYPASGSALLSGWTITIQRVLPLQQNTSLANQGALYPVVVEGALDYLMMAVQQLEDEVGQAVLPDQATTVLATTKSYFDINTGYVTPHQYANLVTGGVLGAGRDDTPAFVAAIATGKFVWVPDGTYLVSSLGTLPNNLQNFQGSSSSKVFIYGTSATATILTTTSYYSGTISGITFTRATAVAQSSGANGLVIGSLSSQFHVRDVISDNSDVNILVKTGCAGGWVSYCSSNGGATANFQAIDPNITFDHCYSAAGYYNYLISSLNGAGAGMYIDTCTGYGATVNNLAILGSSGKAVNDVFIDSFTSSVSGTYGILIDSYGENINIGGETFVEYAGTLLSGAVSNGMHGINVTSNNSNVHLDNIQSLWNSGNGITVGCNGFKITGCTVLGNSLNGSVSEAGSYYGILITGALRNWVVSNNITYNPDFPATQNYGIAIDTAGCTYFTLSGNVVGGIVAGIYTPTNGYAATTGRIANNAGSINAVTTPSVPSSGTAYTNPYAHTCSVTIWGTCSAFYINGSGTGGMTSSTLTFVLKPGDTIAMTYSTAPGWLWNAIE